MEYEINIDTLAVMPNERGYSYVMESETEYDIPITTLNVIKHSCEYFGSSYDGRKIGTYNLLGIQHKNPIIIEESNNIIFFPTISPKKEDCVWLSYENISTFYKGKNIKSTVVEFKNKQKIEVPVSFHQISNQYLRACRLKAMIMSRKIQKR